MTSAEPPATEMAWAAAIESPPVSPSFELLAVPGPEPKPETLATEPPPVPPAIEPLAVPGPEPKPEALATEPPPVPPAIEPLAVSDPEPTPKALATEPPPVPPAIEPLAVPGPEPKPETLATEPPPVPPPIEPLAVPGPEPTLEAVEPPASNADEARKTLRSLIAKHKVRAISIGAGTGARELETVLRQIVSEEGLGDILIASVNDAGIAIYSSSRLGREEFPDRSASARCAVSLARRLQDPLAELVKIDPKLIGVGQYQHDVDQKELHRGLLQTVQYCVNKVGVNANTASDSLLRYVSGLNDKLARRMVAYRNAQGPFRSRASIASAVGMDESTYQQAAGFLRIADGENALDRTAVHPESYPIVEKMASSLSVGIPDLIGNKELISSLRLEEFVTEVIGIPTLNDIREELLRPGRDPRKTFKIPKFRADVKEMADLKPGMALEGTVTNVTNFGAFVDIGVRQDGLVHLSQMSNRFIRDPREAVKVGDVVQVKVISVEPDTKRIGLSMKALLPTAQRRRKRQQRHSPPAPMPAHQSEGTGTGVRADAAFPAAPVERAPSGGRPKSDSRLHEGPPRHRRRGARRPGNAEDAQPQREPAPKVPEPTLQEKIAILQSKFRRIN
jgi:predicted RNA-binding protein with RPS1 domain